MTTAGAYHSAMKVVAIQMRSTEDVSANIHAAQVLLRRAAEEDVDLAVLPEVFTYLGRSASRIDAAEPLPGGPAYRPSGNPPRSLPVSR